MESLDRCTGLLGDLVGFPTVSSDSNLELISWIADQLGRLGARVRVFKNPDGAKANLFASLGPDGDGGIVLSGHTDVVPVEDQDWQTDPFRMTARDRRLYGRGSCDMKGFIAAALTMAPQFAAARLNRPLHFAFTYDEEVGCLGARALAEELVRQDLRPSVAIIGEPTSMRLVEGHKGCCEYTTEFKGLEGHGALPRAGVNAVEYAVRYAGRLMEIAEELRDRVPSESRFEPPWTTLQIGRLAGGVAHNVIPGHCHIDWEIRPVRAADAEFVKAAIDRFADQTLLPAMRATSASASVHRHVVGEVEGLEPADQNEARDIVASLTGANDAELVAFGTEAGIFQTLGMSCVVCGPGAIEQAHKPDEFLECAQLASCLAMLSGLCERLST